MRGIARTSLLGLLFIGLGQAASAADNACEGCTASQMSARARALGIGEHRVYSLSTGVMQGYKVYCDDTIPNGAGGTTESQAAASGIEALPTGNETTAAGGECPMGKSPTVEGVNVSTETTAAWAKILQFYTASGRIDRVDYTFDADVPGTGPYADNVYPMLSDYQQRTDLYDFIFDHSQTFNYYLGALTAELLAHLNILPNQLLISVIFRDGSSIVLKYDGALRQLAYVPNTARLANGQSVVEDNTKPYQGTYRIVDLDDQEAYFAYLRRMGVVVTTIPGRSGSTLECTFDGVKLSCRVYLELT